MKLISAGVAVMGGQLILKASWLDTKLGAMLAISDDKALYLLAFKDSRGLEHEVLRLKQTVKATIMPGTTQPIRSIKKELTQYFNGKLSEFKTLFYLLGSPFQKRVWEALKKIPPGETCSYLDIAKAIDKPTACRAVANANGANLLAIVIPCHRVINANGKLGGYAGGVSRKQWLIDCERKHTLR